MLMIDEFLFITLFGGTVWHTISGSLYSLKGHRNSFMETRQFLDQKINVRLLYDVHRSVAKSMDVRVKSRQSIL